MARAPWPVKLSKRIYIWYRTYIGLERSTAFASFFCDREKCTETAFVSMEIGRVDKRQV